MDKNNHTHTEHGNYPHFNVFPPPEEEDDFFAEVYEDDDHGDIMLGYFIIAIFILPTILGIVIVVASSL